MLAPEKCIGCRTCEIVCSFNKIKAFNPKTARISVLMYDEAAISVPMMCLQCDDPACMKVCPTGAITKGEDGTVTIEEKKMHWVQAVRECLPPGEHYHKSRGKYGSQVRPLQG